MRRHGASSYRLAIGVVATLTCVTSVACAQTPAKPQAPAPTTPASTAAAGTAAAGTASTAALPPAKDVIARYVAAIGGRDAVMRHSSMRSTGTFEMPGAGLKGDLVLVQAKPDKMALTMNIAGMGEIVTAYNGAVAWSINPMQGPRVLEGKELAQMRDDAGFESMIRGGPSIRSLETVERAEMGGQPCYRVKVTYASGRETLDCYSVDTGLLVGTSTKQESPMGVVEVTTLVSDYKDFGGLKSATRMRQQMMGQEQVMTITGIEYDRPDDAAAFAVPPVIQTMLKGGPAAKQAPQQHTPPKP